MRVNQWSFPDQLWYSKEHLWLSIEEQIATVGLTDYAQHSKGDILYVGLPRPGDEVFRGDTAVSIETGKWVGRICSPATGIIVDVNQPLTAKPQVVNEDPYGEGWLIRIQLAPFGETVELLRGEKFRSWFEEQLAMESNLE